MNYNIFGLPDVMLAIWAAETCCNKKRLIYIYIYICVCVCVCVCVYVCVCVCVCVYIYIYIYIYIYGCGWSDNEHFKTTYVSGMRSKIPPLQF